MSDLVPITADPPAATGAAVVVRRHEEAGTRSEAVYSGCLRYRYALTRVWNEGAPRIAFVMLNPSTACERRDDPTIARCRRRALAGGYGAMRIVNLFALRETRPERMRADAEPVGPANDAALAQARDWADAVVAAWGIHGVHQGRDAQVARLLRAGGRRLLHFGLTRGGQPRHPLHLAYAVPAMPWESPLARSEPGGSAHSGPEIRARGPEIRDRG